MGNKNKKNGFFFLAYTTQENATRNVSKVKHFRTFYGASVFFMSALANRSRTIIKHKRNDRCSTLLLHKFSRCWFKIQRILSDCKSEKKNKVGSKGGEKISCMIDDYKNLSSCIKYLASYSLTDGW